MESARRHAVGAQFARQGVRGARLFLRQRAAGLSARALHPARRSAPLRHHVDVFAVGDLMMRITAEMSLYPLRDAWLDTILAFIEAVRDDGRIEIAVNQMSTQMRGELDDVMGVLNEAMRRSFAAGGPQALVVKFLNADLPIAEPPVLEPRA